MLINFNDKQYIIDVGISYRKLKNYLTDFKCGDDVSVFITHTHSDHIKGLEQLVKHTEYNVYGSIDVCTRYDNAVVIDDILNVNDIKVEVLNLSHDCNNTLGYIFYLGKYKVVVVSDTGYLSDANLKKMSNPDVLVLESNHDVDMLMGGRYHWKLKNRVLGDYGHLSNLQFKNYVNNIIGKKTKHVVATHLSEENNCDEKVTEILNDIAVENCTIATQNSGADIIKLNWRK